MTDQHSPFSQLLKIQARDGSVSTIHRNLIDGRTEWFASRILDQDNDNEGEVITLDIHPLLWAMYVRRLYGESISDQEFDVNDEYFCELRRMYALGVKFGDVLFRDEVMDLLIYELEHDYPGVNLDIIVPDCLGSTMPVRKIRRLLVDFIVFGDQALCEGDLQRFFDGIDDQEFKSAIACASLERVTERRWKAPWENVCAFHEHSGDCHLGEKEDDDFFEDLEEHAERSGTPTSEQHSVAE